MVLTAVDTVSSGRTVWIYVHLWPVAVSLSLYLHLSISSLVHANSRKCFHCNEWAFMDTVTQPKTRYPPEYPFSSQIISLSPGCTLNLSTSFLTATTSTYLPDSFFWLENCLCFS